MKKRLTLLLSVLLAFAGCETDTYDSGDGTYSYLRADFVEAHTAAVQTVDYALGDDGRHIALARDLAVGWAATPDSLYRGLLYYNDRPAGAEAVSLHRVYVLMPHDSLPAERAKTDPVAFESAWLSECRRTLTMGEEPVTHYLNLSFYVKTGQADDPEAQQSIGVMRRPGSADTLRLTLLHDQGSIPQYYSTRVYASIPLTARQSAAHVVLTVNTYDGSRDFMFSE